MPTNKEIASKMYGSKTQRQAAKAKGRVFPDASSVRGRSYTSDQAADMKKDHDDILDPDGKVRRYKREKSA